jgi:AraC-like DNA-binding protein
MFLNPGKQIPRWVKAQFFPVAIILAWETWFYFFDPARSKAEILSLFNSPTLSTIKYILIAGAAVALIQYIILLRLETGFLHQDETREPVLISSVLTILYMVDLILVASGIILAIHSLLLIGIFLTGVNGIAYLFFEHRYPDFYQLVAREVRGIKYKRSLILGLDREKIISRLDELMEVEKIYRQMELKLDEVAAMLLITPHQLSEFINDRIKMSFTSYVNRYRVEEAMQLLQDHPEQSALSIAFEVGFGSKQRFNTIFKQQTGSTPSEFRKKLEQG